ncbi:Vitamin B12 ABC transporter, permease protein BtuC [hydrothermal vent metagenome]|uniref:Vitamin B12 ABC transporter, permease protein BtuC n=1 Tax=hydrothermal vent metagenome TaxID=652676 RepID=A0A3B1DDP9_9ZZZZ
MEKPFNLVQCFISCRKRSSRTMLWGMLCLLLVFLFLLALSVGSVSIPLETTLSILMHKGDDLVLHRIIWDLRFPKIFTALLAGAALSVSGLQMQTLFRNALAGPFVLGINAGASLGVALVVLGTGAGITLMGNAGLIADLSLFLAAIIGAGSVLIVVIALSQRVQNNVTLLIVGLIFGMMVNSLVSVLIYFSEPEEIQSYLIWTFGSFRGVTWDKLGILAPAILSGLVIALTTIKPLNALLLGETYARSMGLSLTKARRLIIMSTAILAGSVTAFCGPIGFLGIAVPHLCRGLFDTSDHRILFPAVVLMGAALALLSEIVAQLPGTQQTLPLNAITALLGGPVILWIILKRRVSVNA